MGGRTYVKLEESNVNIENSPFKYVKLQLNGKEVTYYISCNTGEIYTPKVGKEYKVYFNLTTEVKNKSESEPTQPTTQPPTGTLAPPPSAEGQKYIKYLIVILLVFLGVGVLIFKKRR